MRPDLPALLAALADPTRLRVLNLLRMGELCVCYFVAILDAPQPKISRHLSVLREAGLVRARREGKWIHYRLERPADPMLGAVLDAALDAASAERQMQHDGRRLANACCAVKLPAGLENAPRPQLGAERQGR